MFNKSLAKINQKGKGKTKNIKNEKQYDRAIIQI